MGGACTAQEHAVRSWDPHMRHGLKGLAQRLQDLLHDDQKYKAGHHRKLAVYGGKQTEERCVCLVGCGTRACGEIPAVPVWRTATAVQSLQSFASPMLGDWHVAGGAVVVGS